MYLGKIKTSSNIAWHRPLSATSQQEEHLMQVSARALETATDPLEKLRLLCLSRGAFGILGFGRILRTMDHDGSKQVNQDEFLRGLKESGLELSDEDAVNLFERFDTTKRGYISLDDVMAHVRPPMSDSRRAIVEQAFRKLDRNGHGVVTIEDIRAAYCVTAHPRYMSGEESPEYVMNKFLANFESDGQDAGKVTLDEFMNYYSGISVSTDTDCYFDLMMRKAFNL